MERSTHDRAFVCFFARRTAVARTRDTEDYTAIADHIAGLTRLELCNALASAVLHVRQAARLLEASCPPHI